MRLARHEMKIKVEPGGAVALAVAVRGLPDAMRGKIVGIPVTGGNVDAGVFAEVVG